MAEGQYLSDKEIEEFLNDLDVNNDGFIEYDNLEQKLVEVRKEIAPDPKPHHLHHEGREDAQRHQFLRSVIGTDKNRTSRAGFAQIVKGWRVPSMDLEKAEENHMDYVRSIPAGRRFNGYWSVRGPEVMFIALVVSMQIAFGTWQLVKYLTEMQYRHAFGWGIILGKVSAGVLYPTLFFQILSMSRYLSTFMRKSYHLSRFINWDLSQSFHIKMSIVALGFASLHAIGHLTGSFLYISRPAQQTSITAVLGPDAVPRPYRDYVASLPGWSGVTALGLFWILAGLSTQMIRRRNYEIFQFGHLLMFPIIGLLMAHGTDALLQYPMLGYWLAFPTLLVVIERISRIAFGFYHIPAQLKALDADAVAVTVTIPKYRWWPYKAGQYILLQVPKLSFFQWHPFTVSTCIGKEMTVHIKTDGDWTSKLRGLAGEGSPQEISVGIDGPFGAPAQRFYEFDHRIILGSGIGVTPFAGILADLQAREERQQETNKLSHDPALIEKPSAVRNISTCQRVDFHWIVKDKNHLFWFSDLLNSISKSASARSNDSSPHVDVRISTYITQKWKNISTYIFLYLLEIHRPEEHPASLLTGLLNKTYFGRPDLGRIMDEHYESMVKLFAGESDDVEGGKGRKKRKVGVFFCGAPPIGYELGDRCQRLTMRGREERTFIEYHFMMEIFG